MVPGCLKLNELPLRIHEGPQRVIGPHFGAHGSYVIHEAEAARAVV
jgi:hypothetical protein